MVVREWIETLTRLRHFGAPYAFPGFCASHDGSAISQVSTVKLGADYDDGIADGATGGMSGLMKFKKKRREKKAKKKRMIENGRFC